MDGIERVRELLLGATYKYAKSMPRFPHWYTLRETWENDRDFIFVVKFIREHGYQEPFFKKPLTRFNVDDMKYWTMGDTLDNTILINRTFIQNTHRYTVPFDYK